MQTYSMASRPKRRGRKLAYWAGGLLLLIAVAAAVFAWAHGSQQATIINPPAPSGDQTPQNKQFSDAYMQFSYPESYTLQRMQVGAPNLEAYLLTADTTYTKRIAVSVASANLNANTDYTSRASQPKLYSSTKLTIAGEQATMFTKNDGTEQTVFIPHGSIVVVMAFSIQSSNATGTLSEEAQAVVNSLAWR